ncbi:glycosyltransferase, partial [Caenispirillum bisanense]|uniref:glycosyltransferase n=1 Tax=Caenispirillum bisanense TaxID=414052 RepID=UPI0031D99127
MQNHRQRRALVLSFTPISGEPRAIRQACALRDAGWQVTLVGYGGAGAPPAGCRLIEVPAPAAAPSRLRRAAALACLFGARVLDEAAEAYYWLRSAHRTAWRAVEGEAVELVVANDHFTLPLAHRLARRWGARLVADCHEYALGEYPDNRAWNLLYRPYVDSIQRRLLRRADAVTTVSAGIARRLAADYRLAPEPLVVRNMPGYEAQPFRPCGDPVTVLYHGLLVPVREPELLIQAAARLDGRCRLVLRGPGEPAYLDHLRGLAAEAGAAAHVRIEPPVPLSGLVSAANECDVGIFIHRDLSPQMRYVLPNKLFEYIMAGLALCVSDLPEMAAVVRAHDLGVLAPDPSPDAVAATLAGLSRGQIDTFKRRALEAARTLSWDAEKAVF